MFIILEISQLEDFFVSQASMYAQIKDHWHTGLKWNRIHYLIQNGKSKMADGSSSPSFFSNNVIMTSLLLLKSIIYLLVNLIILSDT